MEQVLEFLNTTAGQGLIHVVGVAAIAWVVARVLKAKPEWEKYRGTLTWAVKQAEQLIPDDTPNKNYARFDTALKLAAEGLEGRKVNVTAALLDSFRTGIDIIHRELDDAGKLPEPEVEVE